MNEDSDDNGAEGEDIRANFGVTPYQKQLEGELNAESLAGYYDTPRYHEFATSIQYEAAGLGVQVLSVTHVTGIWLGEVEPADSVEVEGQKPAVYSLAEQLRLTYSQDAVMVITPDPDAEGRVYTLADIPDVEFAIVLLHSFGIDGGRFVEGRLEIADSTGTMAGRLQLLAETFNLKLGVIAASIEFVSREEHQDETN